VDLCCEAVLGCVACHLALWLGARLRIFAFPCAQRLSAHILAVLQILATLQVAGWLAALSRALNTPIRMACCLGADHCTVWLCTLHVATLCVKALAACLTYWSIALWSTCLFAFGLVACPMAQRMTLWLRLLQSVTTLLLLPAVFSVRSNANKCTTSAGCPGRSRLLLCKAQLLTSLQEKRARYDENSY